MPEISPLANEIQLDRLELTVEPIDDTEALDSEPQSSSADDTELAEAGDDTADGAQDDRAPAA